MADPKILPTTERLLEHLRHGEKNAKRQNELAAELCVPPLEIRQMVHDARVIDHIVICNFRNDKGYFLPETQEEIVRQYKMTFRRGKAVFAQLNALITAMQMGGQMSFDDIIAESEAI